MYSSPNIIRDVKLRLLRWAGHLARKELSRNAYRIVVGKSERKSPLGRPRRRWEDNIKMDLKEVDCHAADWVHLVHRKLAHTPNSSVLIQIMPKRSQRYFTAYVPSLKSVSITEMQIAL